jgi:hypothetical protein
LANCIEGVIEDNEIIIGVDYEKNQRTLMNKLQNLIDDYNEEDEDEYAEDDED